jgi:hypothetical protein
MPNRMLRDWTDSFKMKEVDAFAERFFTRLIMKADDYGCFYAEPSLLKAALFPFLSDKVREADISRWMAECQKAGLIVLYEVDGKKYLQIQEFKQRLDKAKNKYPLPPSTDSLTNGNEIPAEVEKENEENKKGNEEGAPAAPPPPKKGKLEEKQEAMIAREKEFYKTLVPHLDAYGKTMIRAFYDYWREANKSRTKMKWELEATWVIELRLNTWANNNLKWNKGSAAPAPSPQPKGPPPLSKTQEELNYLFARWSEDPTHVTVISLQDEHYNVLKRDQLIAFSTQQAEQLRATARQRMKEHRLEGEQKETALMKAFGVLEFFKTLKSNGKETVYEPAGLSEKVQALYRDRPRR